MKRLHNNQLILFTLLFTFSWLAGAPALQAQMCVDRLCYGKKRHGEKIQFAPFYRLTGVDQMNPVAGSPGQTATNIFQLHQKRGYGLLMRGIIQNKMAVRLGAGQEVWQYTLERSLNGAEKDYKAERHDLVLQLGIEKLFPIGRHLRLHVGGALPVRLVQSVDSQTDGISEVSDRQGSLGISAVGGFYVKLLKVLTLGAEVDGFFASQRFMLRQPFIRDAEYHKYHHFGLNANVSLGVTF